MVKKEQKLGRINGNTNVESDIIFLTWTGVDAHLLKEVEKVHTPKLRTIEEVSGFLNVDPTKTVKTLIYHDYVNEKLVAILVRGDREANDIKVVNALNSNENYLELATDEEIKSLGSLNGFVGI